MILNHKPEFRRKTELIDEVVRLQVTYNVPEFLKLSWHTLKNFSKRDLRERIEWCKTEGWNKSADLKEKTK
jgi:hypothetical protein